MNVPLQNNKQDRLITELSRMWKDQQDRPLIAKTIQALDARYDLGRKMANEPGVEEIIKQMAGRLAFSYKRLSYIQNKRILDIACGSNTSKLPASLHFDTPFGKLSFGASRGYTALFEPWFCRILLELEAIPVGWILAIWSMNSLYIIESISGNRALWIFYLKLPSMVFRIAGFLVPLSSQPNFPIKPIV